mmetsp:Transcript_20808/g.34858  ORF Transcript_20808/g.34858 Transcript_20808/m.34858 type:complete len:238 (+) Transcript_20808:1938-2651(+)
MDNFTSSSLLDAAKSMKNFPYGASNGVNVSLEPQTILIGAETKGSSLSGVVPGSPVRIFTNTGRALGSSAGRRILWTRSSSTCSLFTYTDCNVPFTFSSVRTLSKKYWATFGLLKAASSRVRTGKAITLKYHGVSSSLSTNLLFIPPAQLRSRRPLTKELSSVAATAVATSPPILFPPIIGLHLGPHTARENAMTCSFHRSMEYSTSVGLSDWPNPRRSIAYTLYPLFPMTSKFSLK